ncbi:hypothetical protein C7M84_009690 [Penaeus vannamei]|uniref:Uncharacterized protein n=1 Tax=Penaeus vannamei TaxID=6689 RepID=A0A423T6A8_PENVA|nr:hypothetical protein C7M84_009690 [Penaeus vannamei]
MWQYESLQRLQLYASALEANKLVPRVVGGAAALVLLVAALSGTCILCARHHRDLKLELARHPVKVLLVYLADTRAYLEFVNELASFLEDHCYVQVFMSPNRWTTEHIALSDRILFLLPADLHGHSITPIINQWDHALNHFTSTVRNRPCAATVVLPFSGEIPCQIFDLRRFRLLVTCRRWSHGHTTRDVTQPLHHETAPPPSSSPTQHSAIRIASKCERQQRPGASCGAEPLRPQQEPRVARPYRGPSWPAEGPGRGAETSSEPRRPWAAWPSGEQSPFFFPFSPPPPPGPPRSPSSRKYLISKASTHEFPPEDSLPFKDISNAKLSIASRFHRFPYFRDGSARPTSLPMHINRGKILSIPQSPVDKGGGRTASVDAKGAHRVSVELVEGCSRGHTRRRALSTAPEKDPESEAEGLSSPNRPVTMVEPQPAMSTIANTDAEKAAVTRAHGLARRRVYHKQTRLTEPPTEDPRRPPTPGLEFGRNTSGVNVRDEFRPSSLLAFRPSSSDGGNAALFNNRVDSRRRASTSEREGGRQRCGGS